MTPHRDWLTRAGIDTNDRFFFGGLAIAVVGGCFLSVPITLVVLGLTLALLGLRGGL